MPETTTTQSITLESFDPAELLVDVNARSKAEDTSTRRSSPHSRRTRHDAGRMRQLRACHHRHPA